MMIKETRQPSRPRKIRELDWRTEGKKIVFELGGQDICEIERGRILTLLNPKIIDSSTTDYFVDLLTVDFLSRYELGMENFNNDLCKVSEFLGITEERLRRFLGSGYIENFRKSHSLLIDELKSKYRQELFPAEEKIEEALKVSLKEVIKLLKDEKKPVEIAQALNLDQSRFLIWFQEHLTQINNMLKSYEKGAKEADDRLLIRIP